MPNNAKPRMDAVLEQASTHDGPDSEDGQGAPGGEMYFQMLRRLHEVEQELADLQLMHESTIEHATEIENELCTKSERMQKIAQRMRSYLPGSLGDRIVGSAGNAHILAHRRTKLTIFFSDIVDFTALTDSLEPEVLSALLNSYFEEMATIANKWGGVVDKFIGDAILIFFGDKDGDDDKRSAQKCVLMALEMQSRTSMLREQWKKDGVSVDLHIRIGINTGYCTIGSFGAESRMEYTVVGGQVNAASRLERLCPHGGILISESTYLLVKDVVECINRGTVRIRGIHHPVDTFEVIARLDDQSPNALLEIKENGFCFPTIVFNATSTSQIERREIHNALVTALRILEEAAPAVIISASERPPRSF